MILSKHRFVFALLVLPALCSGQGTIRVIAGNGNFGFSGDGGPATSAALGFPPSVAVDGAGNVYFADGLNNRVRKVDTSGIVRTVAGNGFPIFSGDGGPATSAGIAFSLAQAGVAVDKSGNLYIADSTDNRVRKVTPDGIITTFAGNGGLGQSGFSGDGGPATSAKLNSPTGLAVDNAGNLYISDNGNGRVRKVDTSGIITTVAGNGAVLFAGDGGPATSAQIGGPAGLAFDSAGNLYIADTGNGRIRKVNAAGIITTVTGNGTFGSCGFKGAASGAGLSLPTGVAVDAAGNIYATENTGCVRKVDTSGIISTFAGGGSNVTGDPSALLGNPSGLAVDSAGNVYIADSASNKIFKVSLPAATPVVSAALNAASFATNQSLVQGSLASLFGTALAPSIAQASTIPLPPSLAGVSVTIAGVTTPLLFVSPGQINLQVPWTVQSGSADVVVTVNGSVSAAFKATVGGLAPGIFTTQFGIGPAIAINPDGSLAAPAGSIPGIATRPAKAGETIIILGTGFGLVTPAIATGAASSDTLRRTIITPNVLIGGIAAKVSFAGLSPQFVGVNQLNVEVPNVPAGVVSLQIDSLGTRSTDKVTIAVASP